MKKYAWLILLPLIALANSYNSWQPFQPFNFNFLKRVSTSDTASIPDFRVLSDGSIIPTIGTAGTFTRSGVLLYPTSQNTLASAAANTAPNPVFVTGQSAPSATLGGYWGPWAMLNYCTEASTFNNWTAIALGSTSANTTTDPLGGSTADTISGLAAFDGVMLDSGLAAGSKPLGFSVWLKSSSGTRNVSIALVDALGSGGTLGEYTASVTSTWKQFYVFEKFSGATGNAFMRILVGDTTGYSIYGYGAGMYWVDTSNTLVPSQSFYPTIITTGSTVTTGVSNLHYAGTELDDSFTKATFVVWFYYSDNEDGSNIGKANGSTIFHAHKSPAGYETIVYAFYNSSTGRLNVTTPDGGTIDSSYTFSSGQNAWHQLAVSVDGAGTNKVYIDGTEVGSSSATWSSTNFTKLVLGTKFFDGSTGSNWYDPIGWSEIYFGSAKNASEVDALFDAQKANYGVP